MTDSKLIDSSVWLAYFFNGDCIDEIECKEQLLISLLSLFEIKKKLLVKKVDKDEISEKIEFIKQKSIVLSLTSEIAERAAEISVKHNLPAMDALIYMTALEEDVELITLDNDFRGLNKVIVINNKSE